MREELIPLLKLLVLIITPFLLFYELFTWVFTVGAQGPYHRYEYTIPHTLSLVLLFGLIVNGIIQRFRNKDIFIEEKKRSRVTIVLILIFRVLVIPIILYVLYFEVLRILSPFSTSSFELMIAILFVSMLVYQVKCIIRKK